MTGKSKIIVLFFILIFSVAYASAADKPADKDKDKNKDSGAVPNYGLSGSARLTSNYIDRGLSMSDGHTAFNASFLMHLGTQFKFGFWGSNISNLTAADDNLWMKYVAQVFVDFQQSTKMIFYVHDDHYYKSDVRNGQRFGLKIDYSRFTTQLESQNNYEGTNASALYLNIKFTKKYSDKIGVEIASGYTFQNSSVYKDYLDLQAIAFYRPAQTFRTELGMTLPSNTTQFGSRSNIGYFLALNLNYDQ